MFHTFETTQYSSSEQAEGGGSSPNKRRSSTARACEPCRRRKIRCNGQLPCQNCIHYNKVATCHYTEPRQRQLPSRRSVEKTSETLQEYGSILRKLFPNVDPGRLTDLPRETLVELISTKSSLPPPSPITLGVEAQPPIIHPDAGSLEQLQPMPEDRSEVSDNSIHESHALRGIMDDVNALSLSVKHPSSFLGISSVMAVLRVILWLDPDCQAFVTKSSDRSALPSREISSPPKEDIDLDLTTPRAEPKPSSPWDEIPLINAYFEFVHPFVPLIDEQSFRDTYMTRQRTDSRWKLLLNTVLAMGSIAAGSSDDSTHIMYFARAKEHLDLETLGMGNLETLQALALLSGFYLHYVQRPNEANALMGATLRMATTLGLHRDYSEGVGPAHAKKAVFSIEMRRRIWWCIFILDSWATAPLGRPAMGRMSHAITARSPQEPINNSISMLALIQENIQFCIISTRLEDSLALSAIVEETERQSLDASFVEWFKQSSVQNKSSRPTIPDKPGITVAKNVMRWRYLSERSFLHRPVLLWYAMRKMPFSNLSEDKNAAIKTCREVTADLINDIATTWQAPKPCRMAGWNATWLLYQAVMVPLLSLFSDPLDPEIVEQGRSQVETALASLSDLRDWSSTAVRSLEVVSRIYEASRRHSPEPHEQPDYYSSSSQVKNLGIPAALNASVRPIYFDTNIDHDQTAATTTSLNIASQETFMDTMFDSLNWSTASWLDNDNDNYFYPSLSSTFFGTPIPEWDLPTENTNGNEWGFGNHGACQVNQDKIDLDEKRETRTKMDGRPETYICPFSS